MEKGLSFCYRNCRRLLLPTENWIRAICYVTSRIYGFPILVNPSKSGKTYLDAYLLIKSLLLESKTTVKDPLRNFLLFRLLCAIMWKKCFLVNLRWDPSNFTISILSALPLFADTRLYSTLIPQFILCRWFRGGFDCEMPTALLCHFSISPQFVSHCGIPPRRGISLPKTNKTNCHRELSHQPDSTSSSNFTAISLAPPAEDD